jgi:hypothetical protein
MTDQEVIEAVQLNALEWRHMVAGQIVWERWEEATVDPGGSLWGPGPYVKLPVDVVYEDGTEDLITVRVHPREWIRRILASALARQEANEGLDG